MRSGQQGDLFRDSWRDHVSAHRAFSEAWTQHLAQIGTLPDVRIAVGATERSLALNLNRLRAARAEAVARSAAGGFALLRSVGGAIVRDWF